MTAVEQRGDDSACFVGVAFQRALELQNTLSCVDLETLQLDLDRARFGLLRSELGLYVGKPRLPRGDRES